ncbi:MAG: isoprenylcysteine carboxylmethyltransferase family protein [Bacteroidota bacterium]|nr:isoprenylcysteine carboxylmethyltransferase family protein [Bacteroidota bacterium]
MKFFIFIWFLWFVLELVISQTKLSKKSKNQEEKSAKNILLIAVIFGLTLGVVLMYDVDLPISDKQIIPYTGLLLIVLGMFLRVLAAINLRKSTGNAVKTNGTYKLIRHPAYLANLISFAGVGLCFNNILSFFVILVPIYIAFLHKIRIEEKILTEEHGDEYVDYMKKTKKLIPFIFFNI